MNIMIVYHVIKYVFSYYALAAQRGLPWTKFHAWSFQDRLKHYGPVYLTLLSGGESHISNCKKKIYIYMIYTFNIIHAYFI